MSIGSCSRFALLGCSIFTIVILNACGVPKIHRKILSSNAGPFAIQSPSPSPTPLATPTDEEGSEDFLFLLGDVNLDGKFDSQDLGSIIDLAHDPEAKAVKCLGAADAVAPFGVIGKKDLDYFREKLDRPETVGFITNCKLRDSSQQPASKAVWGDVNFNGDADAGDVLAIENHLYLTGEDLVCPGAANYEHLGALNITSLVNTLNYIVGNYAPSGVASCAL